MAGLEIPGVTNRYKTNELIEGLMKIERVPLEREQSTVESYTFQKEAWRRVNQQMTALRESARVLFSFDNPFNNRLVSSSDEGAISATATRDAQIQTFKIDVEHPASADRFLSAPMEKAAVVAAGNYNYSVGDKNISFAWKGGSVSDFASAINKRGGVNLKASLIGATNGKQALLIEGLKTGSENKIVFKDDALSYALESGMLREAKKDVFTFANTQSEVLKDIPPLTVNAHDASVESIESAENGKNDFALPELSSENVLVKGNVIIAPPRSSFSLDIPSAAFENRDVLEFSITAHNVEDVTVELNKRLIPPDLPEPGSAEFKGINISNLQSDTATEYDLAPLEPVVTNNMVFVKDSNGRETAVPVKFDGATGTASVSINMSDYPALSSLIVRNENTGRAMDVSAVRALPSDVTGHEPANAISTAKNAKIRYEGIPIERTTNTIDDVIPNVTLNVLAPTEKPATLKIESDGESAKDALITFVGHYNQMIAEINILTQNKPEIIMELDYFSKDEREDASKRLGMFLSDFTLSGVKTGLHAAVSADYRGQMQVASNDDGKLITMLSQIGIATQSGTSVGYSQSKLRGYLEIDEKKLDDALKNHLAEVKNIFGQDTDGDKVADKGVAYSIDQQLRGYVQIGGILASKTSVLDTKINASQKKIAQLEKQIDSKEAQLRLQYGNMESTLNGLESQAETVTNFSRQSQNNR
ncbi:MAG: flagellar filament capping protein FliD [Treponemataceae bacterium]|nr:MAG: flagellar filament capping protein FliD [Treponemataceae bacterium]